MKIREQQRRYMDSKRSQEPEKYFVFDMYVNVQRQMREETAQAVESKKRFDFSEMER